MKLEKGKTYEVLDSLGIMMMKGKYIGRARRDGVSEILVFQTFGDDPVRTYKFFSAYWEINLTQKTSEEQPKSSLRSKYYANSIKDLGAITGVYKLID